MGRASVLSTCAVLICIGLPGLGPEGAAAGECPDFDKPCELSSKECKTGFKPAEKACAAELKKAIEPGGELAPTLADLSSKPSAANAYLARLADFRNECYAREAYVRMRPCV
jgi:hypothetical protein